MRAEAIAIEWVCQDSSSIRQYIFTNQGHVHLQYVVHFPKGEKYVSLLRNAEDPEAQKVLEAERKRIRAKVRQQQADIAMISQPDEGNPRPRQQPPQPPASPTPHQVSMQALPILCLDKPHASGHQVQATCVSCQLLMYRQHTC